MVQGHLKMYFGTEHKEVMYVRIDFAVNVNVGCNSKVIDKSARYHQQSFKKMLTLLIEY